MAIAYPLVNGNRYDFSSIEVNVNGVMFKGIKSINYNDKLTPGAVYGTNAMKIGRTRGVYEASASIEVFKEDWFILAPAIASLPPFGLGEASFLVTVMYAELLAPVVVDVLGGCRITEVDDSHSQGGDALVIKATIDPMWISRNGVFLVSPPALLK